MNTRSNQKEISRIIDKIESNSADGDYIYRGESKLHEQPPHGGKVSSSLWREFPVTTEAFDIENIQREMLHAAKKHLGQQPHGFRANLDARLSPIEKRTLENSDFEILTEIQHYGGKTNLIDFSTDYFIALFFACNGAHDKNGRVILQKTENIRNMIWHPHNPRHRVIAQKSVFLRPNRGFIEPLANEMVIVPSHVKSGVLQYLQKYHNLSTETIYNDLHGFIRNQDLHRGATTEFYTAYVNAEQANEATNALEQLQRFKKSMQHYSKAIKLNPHFPEAFYNLGWVCFRSGEVARAISHYSTAIQLDPNEARFYNNRGWAYYYAGAYDHAIQDYNKAINLAPDLPLYYLNRALAFLHMQNWTNATSNLTAAKDRGMNIASEFRSRFPPIDEIEQKISASLPHEIITMLQPD